MKFTNRECLEKMLLAMQQGIVPVLGSSDTAKVAFGTVMQGLQELLKRETITPTILKNHFPAGLDIANRQIELLASLNRQEVVNLKASYMQVASFNPAWENVSGLQKKYDELMTHLENCSRALFDCTSTASAEQKLKISGLLKQAAEWELSFVNQQGQPLPASNPGQTLVSTLDAAPLEAFIRKQLPESRTITVENIQRVLGGFGKETWLFDLVTDAGLQPLVVRKNNIAPGLLDRGTWQINQEFSLIQLVYQEGITIPEPLWMSMKEPGINTPFFIARRVSGKAMGTFMKGNDDLTEGLWCQVAEQLAKIHTIPIQRFSGYISEFYGDELQNATASQGMRHYLNWWHDYWKSFDRISSPMEIYLFDWLYNNLPDDRRPASLIHSDFGPHNMLADGDRLTAILDWESTLFGSPAMDLAYVKRWVTETMDWQNFVDHYERCGGPHIDQAEYAFCDALTYMRTLTGTNMSSANLRFHKSTEYKELLLGLQFVPQMMISAFNNTV